MLPPRLADLYAGTSTGAILAAALACGLDLTKIRELYLSKASTIFKSRPSPWTHPAGWARSFIGRGLLGPIYDNTPLAQELRDLFGERFMPDANRPLMIVAYDCTAREPLVIRSWKTEHGSIPVWKAVLASAAAPVFFPPVGLSVDGSLRWCVDGGLVANDPAGFALTEGRTRFSAGNLCILNFGTGRSAVPFQPGNWGAVQWISHLVPCLMDSSESVDYALRSWASVAKLAGCGYLRFQPSIPESLASMDEPGNVSALEAAASVWADQDGRFALKAAEEWLKQEAEHDAR
jgi:predicted acylesterase/phospholipase RssA